MPSIIFVHASCIGVHDECEFIYGQGLPCGGRKTSPRTSTIVQFIFYFWSFEISVNILRNQK